MQNPPFLTSVWTRTTYCSTRVCVLRMIWEAHYQWLSVWGLQAELETLWSWRRWICRLSPISAHFTSKSAASSSPNDSLSTTFSSSSPFALTDSVAFLRLFWFLVLSYRSRIVLNLNPSISEVGASFRTHYWSWRVNVSIVNDWIDLDSLLSFCIGGKSTTVDSFRYAKIKMNSMAVLFLWNRYSFSGIVLLGKWLLPWNTPCRDDKWGWIEGIINQIFLDWNHCVLAHLPFREKLIDPMVVIILYVIHYSYWRVRVLNLFIIRFAFLGTYFIWEWLLYV